MNSPILMMKRASLFILNALFTLMFVFSADGTAQTDKLKTELGKSFNRFDVTRLEVRSDVAPGQNQKRISLSAAGRIFDLVLTPTNLLSNRYKAKNTDQSGLSEITALPAQTFKGKIAGEESSSEVRLSFDGTKVEGFFISAAQMYFIEPALKYSKFASPGNHVIYKKEDLVSKPGFDCGVEDKIDQGVKMIGSANVVSSPTQAMKVMELATEADFEYVTALGGAQAANQEILNILNMAEGVFNRDLNVSITVVYQHTWSTADPFISTSPNSLLVSFKDYWNTNFPASQVPRDAAHLFTAKTSIGSQGLAYISVVCRAPLFAYGFSGRVDQSPGKFQLSAHELAHNLGATHADAAQGCAGTLMNASLSFTTQFAFCDYSQSEVKTFTSANSSCLTTTVVPRVKYDFDGDKRADIGVFRPSDGIWYVTNSSNNPQFTFTKFGMQGDKPVTEDYDGDGKADIAVFRNGAWYILRSSNGTFLGIQFGLATDIPTPADYDGDGRSEISLYRPSEGNWYFLNTSTNYGFTGYRFGSLEDIPVPADYDGDGKADINVYRPSEGNWYRLNSGSGNSFQGSRFGITIDIPVAADFDGDGKADIAVFRPTEGNWYMLKSGSANTFYGEHFGQLGDTPVAADYNGDGKADIAVFRRSSGVWFIRDNSANGYFGYQFGLGSDLPIQAR